MDNDTHHLLDPRRRLASCGSPHRHQGFWQRSTASAHDQRPILGFCSGGIDHDGGPQHTSADRFDSQSRVWIEPSLRDAAGRNSQTDMSRWQYRFIYVGRGKLAEWDGKVKKVHILKIPYGGDEASFSERLQRESSALSPILLSFTMGNWGISWEVGDF